MTLNDMPIEPAIHHHAAFQINFVTHLQLAKIGLIECFLNGRHGIRISLQIDHR
jgi:hypothetical protein